MNMSDYKPKHFNWLAQNGVAVITLKGAERKNPITFESYAELGQTFRDLSRARYQGHYIRFERRQFLFRRRRSRHHRTVAEPRHERTSRVHPYDRRTREGDARLSATDNRCN